MKSFSLFCALLVLGTSLVAQVDSLVLRPGSSAGKDATVWSINPTTNYGSTQEATLTAWTYGGTPSFKRFYIEFDLSSLPSGTVVDSAFLFYYNNPTASSHNGEHSGANSYVVRRVTSSWTETAITFSNQPTSTTINQVSVPATTSSHQNFKIDVTDLTQDQLDYGNYGYFLRLDTEATYRAIVCASSDHIVSGYRPMLKVYYNSCTELEAGFNQVVNGTTVQFTDTTNSSSVISRLWDFGDGTFSSLPNPIKTYNTASTYNVCLSITDSCDSDTICRQISLCTPAIPVIYHNSTGLQVQFQAQPINALGYWWDFGDGNFTLQQNPLYTYSASGTYEVCLAITDECGTDTTCTTILVSGIGIQEEALRQFSLFPNPANSHFYVEGDLTKIKGISIYNAIGQLEQTINEVVERVDILGLPTGFYIIKIETMDGLTLEYKLLKR